MVELFVQSASHRDFDETLAFAKAHKYNLELHSFCYSDTLDGNWKELVSEYKKKLRDFEGSLAFHGVFIGMEMSSLDKKIVAVCKERVLQTLDIIRELGGSTVVFHSDYNPLIENANYPERWISHQTEFWKEIVPIAQRDNILITFENVNDTSPKTLNEVINRVSSPFFKSVLVTGHANHYSGSKPEQWVDVLGDNLAYIHLNDSDGVTDRNLVPGKGNISWTQFFNRLSNLAKYPPICIGVGGDGDRLDNIKESIRYLIDNGFLNGRPHLEIAQ